MVPYPFYIDGQKEGSFTAQLQGQKTVFTITARDGGKGLYKAFLCGSAGRLPLGSLLPQGGSLYLKRSVPNETLKCIGKLQRGEGILSFLSPKAQSVPEGWRQEPNPQRLFQDPLLSRALGQTSGALVREAGDRTLLALPIYGGVFPLTPLFCLSRIETLDGRDYAVFCVTKDGVPGIPGDMIS